MTTSLAREDYLALATFPFAAVVYTLANAWLRSVHSVSNKPLAAKFAQRSALEAEAELLNRTDTFALFAKKRREITRLDADIDDMKAKRTTPRRRAILAGLFYFILFMGVFPLRFVVKNLGLRPQHGAGEALEMQEIVMVPHLFTSLRLDKASDSRVAIPAAVLALLPGVDAEDVRSIGYIVWYCFCLLSVRTVFHAFFPGIVPAFVPPEVTASAAAPSSTKTNKEKN